MLRIKKYLKTVRASQFSKLFFTWLKRFQDSRAKLLGKFIFVLTNGFLGLSVIVLVFGVHAETQADEDWINFSTITKVDPEVHSLPMVSKTTDVKKNEVAKNAIAKISRTQNPDVPAYVMVHASNSATFSSETTATIIKIPSKEGNSFKHDDILIEFDCRVQHAEQRKAIAQQAAANSAYRSALKLNSYGSISEFELIKAKSESEMASAEVEKLSAVVDKCIIKAPYNGAVSELMVHVGETVKPGDPLIKIVSLENLELQLQVPSTWLEWLRVGSIFEVIIAETQKTFPAKIIRINPEIDPISQTIKVIGSLITPEPTLQPGMSGQANFPELRSTIDHNNKESKNGE